ncbi:MAG TPA: Gx transporter family protein [Methylophilaceae bacterium]|nr:Gx transporter family protein [Methylophilaceae bacterium]HQR59981.1 Gx transporter family protein [Methylophilaceae bacterium]
MTRSTIEITLTPDDHRVARLAAIAIGLHLVESLVPSPLPGVKPGIANIVTLYVLYRFNFATAAWVSLLRVVASSLLLGNFLSPAFALSLVGAISSLTILFFAARLPRKWYGPVTLSILAAFAHIAGQLLVVRLWLIPHAGVAYLIPVFAAAALFFGLVNGLIAARLLRDNGVVSTDAEPEAST